VATYFQRKPSVEINGVIYMEDPRKFNCDLDDCRTVMEGVKFVRGFLKPKKKAKSCTVKKVKD
jgi:hypothetical protein